MIRNRARLLTGGEAVLLGDQPAIFVRLDEHAVLGKLFARARIDFAGVELSVPLGALTDPARHQ